MVQRIALYGSVSLPELPLALRSLEAVSGMPPRDLHIITTVYEPAHKLSAGSVAGAVGDQYRLFAVKDVNSGHSHVEAREMPEAGRQIKVISQQVNVAEMRQGDPESLMKVLGYSQQKQFEQRGYEFVLRDCVTVHLFQLFNSGSTLPVDSSGQYTVAAFVNVKAVTDLRAVERASGLLLQLQQELRGAVPLRAPTRQSFNTRLRA